MPWPKPDITESVAARPGNLAGISRGQEGRWKRQVQISHLPSPNWRPLSEGVDDTSRRKGSRGWQSLGPTYLVYGKLWNSQISNARCSVWPQVLIGNQRGFSQSYKGKMENRALPKAPSCRDCSGSSVGRGRDDKRTPAQVQEGDYPLKWKARTESNAIGQQAYRDTLHRVPRSFHSSHE